MVFYTKTSKGAHQLLADLVKLSREISQFVVDLSDLKQLISSSRRQRTLKTINYLKSAGYLQPLSQTKYGLTDLGKVSVLNELAKRRQPDGKLRIIIFDIPEKFRWGRDALRKKLKELGFCEFQKSVFVFPYDCKDEIDFIIEFFNIRKYVRYGVFDYVDNAVHLKEFFNLK